MIKSTDGKTEIKGTEQEMLMDFVAIIHSVRKLFTQIYNEEMADKIRRKEARLPGLQSQLVVANKDLQKTEMEFLLHGVLIDRSRVEAESDNEVVGAESSYTFTKRSYGSSVF